MVVKSRNSDFQIILVALQEFKRDNKASTAYNLKTCSLLMLNNKQPNGYHNEASHITVSYLNSSGSDEDGIYNRILFAKDIRD